MLLRNLSGRWLRSRATPCHRGTLSRSTLVGVALTAVLALASCTVRTTTAPPTVPSGWPDTGNTGPPASQQPCTTTVNGNFEVPGPNFVMNRWCINNGSILIGTGDTNLRVDNSVIRSVGFAGAFQSNESNLLGLRVEDTEIDCQFGEGASGIAGGNYTASRLEIRNCENGLSLGSNVTFSHSLIHRPDNTDDSHADGVQGAGFDNVLFERNVINFPLASGGFQYHSNTGNQNSNVVVRYNKILGGAAALRLPGDNPNCRPPNFCGPWSSNQVYGNRIDFTPPREFFHCSGDPDSIAVWGAETGNPADRNVDDSSGTEILRSRCA